MTTTEVIEPSCNVTHSNVATTQANKGTPGEVKNRTTLVNIDHVHNWKILFTIFKDRES